MQDKIAIIGVGRLGKALSKALLDSEVNLVGIYDRDTKIKESFARKLNIPFFENPYELIAVADTVFLTVPDGEIESLAQCIAKSCPQAKCYFHCSGAHGLELLAALSNSSDIGCFHPLQSFSGETGSLKNVHIAVDGTERAIKQAQSLVNRFGASSLMVPSADKALYHAAACILSNYLVTLNVVAENIFARWNIPKSALQPLLMGSVGNILATDNTKLALTGPIGRGDAVTVARHLAVLPPEYIELYRVLAKETCKIAQENKTNADGLRDIMQLLTVKEG